jgi:hypothetical protein
MNWIKLPDLHQSQHVGRAGEIYISSCQKKKRKCFTQTRARDNTYDRHSKPTKLNICLFSILSSLPDFIMKEMKDSTGLRKKKHLAFPRVKKEDADANENQVF